MIEKQSTKPTAPVVPTGPTSYEWTILTSLGIPRSGGKVVRDRHVYGGTVRPEVKRVRRRRNKAASQARRINRKRSSR